MRPVRGFERRGTTQSPAQTAAPRAQSPAARGRCAGEQGLASVSGCALALPVRGSKNMRTVPPRRLAIELRARSSRPTSSRRALGNDITSGAVAFAHAARQRGLDERRTDNRLRLVSSPRSSSHRLRSEWGPIGAAGGIGQSASPSPAHCARSTPALRALALVDLQQASFDALLGLVLVVVAVVDVRLRRARRAARPSGPERRRPEPAHHEPRLERGGLGSAGAARARAKP